jgi:hypothetical protein
MSYLQPYALEHALDVPGLETKIEALTGYVLEVAQTHDPRYKVATYADEAVVNVRDRAGRVRVMGDPARYIEVLYAGDQGSFETRDDVRHLFNVFVYRGVGRSVSGEAEGAFRALMESRSASQPGILFALRAQPEFQVQSGPHMGHILLLTPPANVQASLVRTQDATDWRHECAFAITVA